jgi:predicted dehydrogenase
MAHVKAPEHSTMKQVIQSARSGKLSLHGVPEPRVRGGHLLVKTGASLISAGTERMVIDFAKKNLAAKASARPDLVRKVIDKARRDGIMATFRAVMARLDEPLPLGYSAAGEVMAVGAGLEGAFKVGDRIAMAGAGLANHAELNVVPRNLAALLPDDVPYEQGAFGTVGAIAMAGIRTAQAQLGDVVAVIGAGLVGQLAIQLLALQGARVIALDINPQRLALAKSLGAEKTWTLGEAGLTEAVAAMTGGIGVDSVVICAATDSAEPLHLAAELARDRARVVMVGKTGTEFDYAAFMKKELTLTVSRSYGPGRYDEDFEGRGVKYPVGWVRWTETENLRESVRLMAPSLARRLDVGALISHRFDFDQAEAAYGLITGGTEPSLGVVLAYAQSVTPASPLIFPAPKAAGGCVLGVIGAGSFARTVLLPELKRLPGLEMRTICTQRGASAEHSQQSFGFANATTDVEAVLDDPAINAVLVATRHGNHAEMTARVLAAGKSVLVEKPLALDRGQLAQVSDARQASTGFFLVGFNRRFAPMSLRARDILARHDGPKVLLLRVNAGALPPESWVNAAEEGGGRILGELCHFVDLARMLAGSPITAVQAGAARVTHGGCDDLSVSLTFKDGSLATIVYTAQGDSAYSKERFECFAGGTVVVIDNFLSLSITENGKTRTEKAMGQDKGHRAELEGFVRAVAAGGPPPADESELIETSLATIAVLESLRDGRRVDLES